MDSFNRVSIAIIVLLGNIIIMFIGAIYNTVPLQLAGAIIVSNTCALIVMSTMKV